MLCRLRKARALEQDDKVDVPEALQQKSSALVPPATSSQTEEAVPTTPQPTQATTSSHSSLPSDTLSTGSEKMDIDSHEGNSELSVTSASTTTSSASSIVASVSASTPASESISPGLAAASLVAVCSSPQIPLQGTPLASISSTTTQVADLKSMPGTSTEQQGIDNVSLESSKSDVDSKVAAAVATGEGSVKGTKEEEEVDQKSTALKPPEMTEKRLSSPESDSATTGQTDRTGSLTKQVEQTDESNVTKGKEEGRLPASLSQTTTQTVPQGSSQRTSPADASHETSSTSSKVVSPTALKGPSGSTSQVTGKIASSCSSNTSRVTSPAAVKVTPQDSSDNLSTVISKGAPQGAANISTKVTSSALIKVSPQDSCDNASKMSSKSAQHGVPKGEAHKAPCSSQSVSPVPHSFAKQATHVTSSGVVHPSQTTAASSSAPQPSKTKPVINSETQRPTAVKPFQHLPAGMTASSSKQFSAIASVVTKESSKDPKTDPGKTQDQGDSAKL